MPKDRDIGQRLFGFLGFSFLVHVGAIIAAFVIPGVALTELAQGTNRASDAPKPAGETVLIDTMPTNLPVSLPASLPANLPAPKEPKASAQLEASDNDPTAVMVPVKKPESVKQKAVVAVPEPAKTKSPKSASKTKAVKAATVAKALPSKKQESHPAQAAPKLEQPVSDVEEKELADYEKEAGATDRSSDDDIKAALAKVPTEATDNGSTDSSTDKLSDQAPDTPDDKAEATKAPPAAAAKMIEKQEPKEAEQRIAQNQPETAAPAPVTNTAPVQVNQARPAQQQVQAPVQTGLGGVGARGLSNQIRNGDDLFELAGNPKPQYPQDDAKSHRQGTTVFLARVTEDGRVTDIRLEKSATALMNQAAFTAFKDYRYKAGQQGWIRKTFSFRLTLPEQEIPARLRR